MSWLPWMVCGVLAVVSFGQANTAADASNDQMLQIHLPREITVIDNNVNLNEVSVMRGPEGVVAKASKIGLGRFSAPGQKVVLDRTTILSRLASSGISADHVRLTGAEAVTVQRQQKIVQTEDFLDTAEQFLRQYPIVRSASKIVPVIRPRDLVLADDADQIVLIPKLARQSARGQAIVEVTVTVDGREVETRDVAFRMRYERRQLVAIDQIAEGTILSPENIKIEMVESDQPDPAGWKPPYGLPAVRTIPAGTKIRSDMIGVTPSTVFVQRNETVQIRLERPGILVTAMGTALQEAHVGECLRVRNADSNRVVICQVKADGTVEPML